MIVVGIEKCGNASLFIERELAMRTDGVWRDAQARVIERGGRLEEMDAESANAMPRCAGCLICGPVDP